MLKRSIEQKLIKTINNFPVTGIIGPRQVGKTTLAKKIAGLIKKESIYLDLENPRNLVMLSDPMLFFEANIDKCIIIDEIQLMPELFALLRSSVDNKRVSSRFIVLGSASPDLIRESSQSLAGRIAYIELGGFNITEVGNKNLRKLWLKGGFPDAFLESDNEIWEQWLDNFINSYIRRDLPMLGLNVNQSVLRNLWMMTAHLNGSVVNYSNLSRSLELSSTTIKKYLGFLENAFLIRQLKPYFFNAKKRLVKSPKIFIRDTGVLHNLLNISSDTNLEGNPAKGSSFEGFVIEQILQSAGSKMGSFYYRTHQGSECDLVLTKSNLPYMAIEIKYSSAPKLTKGNLLSFEDIGAEHNFIVTPDTDDYLINKKTRVCSLQVFLEKYI
jgi:predicted AAA+ superfamily ATPase